MDRYKYGNEILKDSSAIFKYFSDSAKIKSNEEIISYKIKYNLIGRINPYF